MPQTDWANLSKSSDARRKLRSGVVIGKTVVTLKSLMKQNRDQLNALAKKQGIENAETMTNKREVAEAIINA